jgi:hypothetical protein
MLGRDVQDILQACGFAVSAPAGQIIKATRNSAGKPETTLVWVPNVDDAGRARSDVLQGLATPESKAATRRIVLLPKLLSLGAPFQTEVRQAGGIVRTYAQFYDAPFVSRAGDEDDDADLGLGSADRAAGSSDYSREQLNYGLLDRDTIEAIARPQTLTKLESERRVASKADADDAFEDRPRVRAPQPYFRRDGLAPHKQTVPDADLFRHLTLLMNQPPTGPEVYLIVGSAGGGKSVVFSALFTYLYEVFMKRKQAQTEGMRPIPVMPESLLRADAYSTEALFKAVAETEVAAALDPRLLDKFVRDGRVALMIDGLDEFFAEQDDFFSEINGRYLVEGSNARIVIALRDSLLSSSPNVERLVGALSTHTHCTLRIFELAAWEDREAKRALAWLRLEGRLPNSGDQDPAAVAGFLTRLETSPMMNKLARLPFWCNELIKDYQAQQAGKEGAASGDEYDLLERALTRLIEREWNKHRESRDGRVVPEAAFVPAVQARMLALERMILSWTTWGPTAVIDSLLTGTPHDLTAGPTLREVLDSKYAADGDRALRDLLEEAAWRYRRLADAGRSDEQRSLDVKALGALYDKRRSWAVGREDRLKGRRILRHFALFGQGEHGGVDFAHDYMADYLASRFALREILETPARFCKILGSATLGETDVFSGYLRRELSTKPAVITQIRAAVGAAATGPCAEYAKKILA